MKLATVVCFAACGTALAESGPDPKPVSASWRVHVKTSASSKDSLLAISQVWATRTDRPTVLAGGRVETKKPETTVVADPHLRPSNDQLISVAENADTTEVWTPGGEHYVIPGLFKGRQTVGARYYDLAPGIVGINHADRGATLRRYDRNAKTPTWERKVAAPFAVDDAMIVGWVDRDDAVIALEGESTSDLLALHVPDGATREIARVAVAASIGTFVVAGRAGLVASIESVDRCASCGHVEVRSIATGQATQSFNLPADAAIWPLAQNESIGFDGAELWGYDYQPARGPGDMIGLAPAASLHPERCFYEVYDARSGARLRTLSSAIDEWAQISGSCAVRALLPTLDGGALAFSVSNAHEASVVKFSAAP